MRFFKGSFFKSTDKSGSTNEPELNEKKEDSPQQEPDLEKQQLASERVPQNEPHREAQTTPSTPKHPASSIEKIVSSDLQIPAPPHVRRQSAFLKDPFTDDAIASLPVTPTRRSSELPPEAEHRRKSSTVSPIHVSSPHKAGDRHRRKSSLVAPHSVVSPQIVDGQHSRRSSVIDLHSVVSSQIVDGQNSRGSSIVDPHSVVSSQIVDGQNSRGSSIVDPHSAVSPQIVDGQHRRRSSVVDPHSAVSEQIVDGQHRRRSSAIDPHSTVSSQTVDSQHRRRSSTIDPHTPVSRSSAPDQTSQRRNDTRHITFAIPEDAAIDEVDEDAIVLAKPPPAVMSPLFNQEFTLNGTRRASDSLQNQHLLNSSDDYHPGQQAGRRRSSCVMVNRRASKYTIEEEKEVRQVGKKRLYWTKVGFIIAFILLNCGFTAISWIYPKYWYAFAPVILLGNCLNTAMVLNIVRYWIQSCIVKGFRKLFNKPKAPLPTDIPTTIAMVLACYCESYTDLMRTLDSLSEQEKIDHHQKMFIVVCDGQVKGKGMEKSTDRILVEDIFKPDEELFFPVGYESWDGVINGIYASAGTYNGIPYCCIVKKRNLGKRDGLILVRSLLHKYKERHENPVTTMGNDFFTWFCEFSESHGIEKFEWLVGVDADTTFNKECIYELHKDCLADPKLLGSSGLIQVGWQTGNWNLWNIYQNTEYMRAQCLRRMHQAKGTGKVSCLPGACQIIKICEESCGDKILIDLFGQIPDPKSNMIHQVRALAGEDRNYICLIFFNSPHVQTTMSMKAIAFTDPPNGVMVFLSQRKRWTLSTCANDLLIISKKQMNWFERICSTADVLCWGLPFFIMQTFVLFVRACVHLDNIAYLLGFATLTIVPLLYDVVVAVWACHTWKFRLQYLLGMVMVVSLSQFVTPVVIAYAIWHMDNFSWGKTREIEDDGNPDNKPAHSD